MGDRSDKDRDGPADAASRKEPAGAGDREARLAAALRANLRRRKAASPRGGPKDER